MTMEKKSLISTLKISKKANVVKAHEAAHKTPKNVLPKTLVNKAILKHKMG